MLKKRGDIAINFVISQQSYGYLLCNYYNFDSMICLGKASVKWVNGG